MTVVGVDASRRGWFVVALDDQWNWRIENYDHICQVWQTFNHAKLILIDIPIGLPSKGRRLCDVMARRILKERSSSIFPAPCREALAAESYREASRINQNILGKKLTVQTWSIMPKIRQVDELMASEPEARRIMHEAHPELCFWAFSGGTGLQRCKKTAPGFCERQEILQRLYPQTASVIRSALTAFKRKDLAEDDIIDAVCLSVTALSDPASLLSLPPEPLQDTLGLPMEIVFSSRHLSLKIKDCCTVTPGDLLKAGLG